MTKEIREQLDFDRLEYLIDAYQHPFVPAMHDAVWRSLVCSECHYLNNDCECCADCGNYMCTCIRCTKCDRPVDECECDLCPKCGEDEEDCTCQDQPLG